MLDLDMVVFADVRLRLPYFLRSLFLALLSYLSASDRLVVRLILLVSCFSRDLFENFIC